MSRDFIRAVVVEGEAVRFVIEAPTPEIAGKLADIRAAAEQIVMQLDGVSSVTAVVTAHEQKPAPPNLKVGGHPKPQDGPLKVPGVDRVVAIASGKGGVGKSTVSSNLAVALAKQGRRVGLLDADIYGPSQPRMMGVSKRPASPDGKVIIPLQAHGVTMMSIGLMVDPNKAVVWRGPMLMGALQQMLNQVQWGELDVLIIDLPPGTGDVQLTLCQKTELTGAIVVSTPQDVALLDARKALDMFATLHTPILGMIENMSSGSISYDLAAIQGGNTAHTKVDEIVDSNGVKIMGESNILNKLPTSASNLYAKNVFNFVSNLYDKENNKININLEDEIIEKTLIK